MGASCRICDRPIVPSTAGRSFAALWSLDGSGIVVELMPGVADRIGLLHTTGFLAFGGNLRRTALRGELSRHRTGRTTVALPNNGDFGAMSLSDRCLTLTSHSSHFVCVWWKRSADSLGVNARHGCKQTTTGIARHRKFKPCHSDQTRLSL